MKRTLQGFTLIEVLIALAAMSLMALLSWRAIDGMLRTQEITQSHAQETAAIQAGLAQWGMDLDSLYIASTQNSKILPLLWDGKTLRLTRSDSTSFGTGLHVVAWTRRNIDGTSMWMRWQSLPLRSVTEWQSAWTAAAVWADSDSATLARLQTPITAMDDWTIYYFRDNSWSNPLSSEGASSGAANNTLPRGVRLILTLPDRGVLSGTLTRDWIQATDGGGKS